MFLMQYGKLFTSQVQIDKKFMKIVNIHFRILIAINTQHFFLMKISCLQVKVYILGDFQVYAFM